MNGPAGECPGATVVVPTLNRGGVLADCLSDLVRQTHRPLDILVVDQSASSPREVLALVERYPDLIRYHRVDFKGLPLARNFGWQQARHEAIIYVDDDIRCEPDFVAKHVTALQTPDVGVVGGGIDERYKPADIAPPTGRYGTRTGTLVGGFGAYGVFQVDHVRGCNFSIWKQVAQEIGGFEERLNVGAALGEETDFCLRAKKAGYKILFCGDARLSHLAANDGGCRVNDLKPYLCGLVHNRCLLTARHVRPAWRPVAYSRLCLTGMSYAFHYRKLDWVVAAAVAGFRGSSQGRKAVVCTPWSPLDR